MNEKTEKIQSVINEKRIKSHNFIPSERKIWTVLGTEKEHWLDPDLQFCSCSGFYFGMLKNKNPCYHMKAISIAIKEKKFDSFIFSDTEFENFIVRLITNL